MFPPAQYLSRLKPFSFLSESEISELLSGMDIVLYKKGKTIFESSEKIKKFYFVREGKIGLFYNSDFIGIVEKDEIIEIGLLEWKESFKRTCCSKSSLRN